MTKTRFAPSPTGHVHIGNVRTALFNALLAMHDKGIFLLRIEDTDLARSSVAYTQQLKQDLLWLDLTWQEGPDVGGPQAPYFQAERQAIYAQYYQQLESMGLAYPCFCTDQELAIARKVQLAAGKPPRYSGTCRGLSQEHIAQKTAQGLKPTLRFKVPENHTIEFQDIVRGAQRYLSNDIGDFIIRRSDGGSAFFFCNAIDDAVMGVTHVLRGEDHLTNTPRQLMLLQALKLPAPQYGHIPLIVGHDGAPLSKRHGSRSLKELNAAGFLPQAIVNYLARLGHYYADNRFMDLSELARQFSLTSLGSAPAHYDEAQLIYWQKQAVQHLNDVEIWRWLGEDVHNKVPVAAKNLFLHTVRANITFPKDALHWATLFFEDCAYSEAAKSVLAATEKAFFSTAIAAVQQHGVDFKAVSQAIAQTLAIKGKALFQPLRVALTGELHGPEMAAIFELLGKEKIIARLLQAAAGYSSI